MKPPIELYRPTILNIIAIICYCLALLFHIIAYATNNWASLLLDGVRWRMGLFQGCTDINNTEYCTSIVFENKVFQTGSDWHLGARVMMTLALILIFLLEFPLIAYACIKNLERYRNRLVGITLGLSVSTGAFILMTLILCGSEVLSNQSGKLEWSYGVALLDLVFDVLCFGIVAFDYYKFRLLGKYMRKSKNFEEEKSYAENRFSFTNSGADLIEPFCHFLVLIMYGSEVDKIPESEVKGSYGIVVISFLLELLLPVILYIDKRKQFPEKLKFIIPKRFLALEREPDLKHGETRTSVDGAMKSRLEPYTIAGSFVSMRTSATSLSEIETFKKFASVDDLDPSTASLGSMNSINTRSTMYTTISLTDKGSLESGV